MVELFESWILSPIWSEFRIAQTWCLTENHNANYTCNKNQNRLLYCVPRAPKSGWVSWMESQWGHVVCKFLPLYPGPFFLGLYRTSMLVWNNYWWLVKLTSMIRGEVALVQDEVLCTVKSSFTTLTHPVVTDQRCLHRSLFEYPHGGDAVAFSFDLLARAACEDQSTAAFHWLFWCISTCWSGNCTTWFVSDFCTEWN